LKNSSDGSNDGSKEELLVQFVQFVQVIQGSFDVQLMPARRIAIFAGHHAIALSRLSPTCQRDQVIHGEELFGKLAATMMAEAWPDLLLPPRTLAEFLGFPALAFDVFRVDRSVKQHGGNVTQPVDWRNPIWRFLNGFAG
jgi:hypothetical protein